MVNKIRPEADVCIDYGMDGDGWVLNYYIKYSCPTCGQIILGYRSETACDRCGTFYDWGVREPKIKVTRTVEW